MKELGCFRETIYIIPKVSHEMKLVRLYIRDKLHSKFTDRY